MPDSFFLENCTQSGPMLNSSDWMKLKLIDNGDGTYSYAMQIPASSSRNISGAGTTLVKSGAGVLVAIVNNKTISSTVTTVYDSLTAAGTKLATLANPLVLLTSQFRLEFNVSFTNGLTVVTSGSDDITVIYR